MQRQRLLLVPVLSSVVLAAMVALPADTLAFHVAAKAKLTKTFETKLSIESREISMTIDGENPHGGIATPTIAVEDEEKFVFVDEHVAVEDGRTTKLRRHFDALEGKVERKVSPPGGGESKEQTEEKESPLDGKDVVFTWKDDAYEAAWPEGEKGDDALLEGLVGDADLAGFLPEKAVSDGDTWKLEPKLFNRVTSPGGDLRLHAKRPDGSKQESDPLRKVLEEKLDGSAKATYRGTREVGGIKVSVVEIEAKLEAKGSTDVDGDDTVIEYGIEYSGELLWDAQAGHLHSMKLTGKLELSTESTHDLEVRGEKHELHRKTVFGGELVHTISVE
jgi:hypothetical protein